MSVVAQVDGQLKHFSALRETIRQRMPAYEEFPLMLSEADARAFVLHYKNNASRPFRLDVQDQALLCRYLVLPEAVAEEKVWRPLLQASVGATLYLLMRAMLQFFPDSALLEQTFCQLAGDVSEQPKVRQSVLSVLQTNQDHLLAAGSGEKPLSLLLNALLESGTLIGLFAADQRLVRDALLYQRLREAFFTHCSAEHMDLDARELLQCLEAATPHVQRAVLGHFLAVHAEHPYPETLSRQLVEKFGEPSEDTIWREAASWCDQAVAQGSQGETEQSHPGEDAQSHPGEALLDAFVRWVWLERMKTHFGENTLKTKVMERFLPHLRRQVFDPEWEAMLLHFEGATVIDFKQMAHFSWICDPTDLSQRFESMVRSMLDQDVQGSGYRKKRAIPEARDFVMEQENGSVIRLTYAEVGILYAVDAMSIRLGLMAPETWGEM